MLTTLSITLPEDLNRFVGNEIASGRFGDASEVVRAALTAFEQEEQEEEAKLVALRKAIDEGDASGIVEGDVFKQVREALAL